jgi:CRISPR-associated Csx3 family protein
LAVHVAPAPCYLFDARHFGWMAPPPVLLDSDQPNAEFTLTPRREADHIRLVFTRQQAHYFLRPRPVHVPTLPAELGVVLDGPMPIWLWAALARALHHHPWLAAYEPRHSRIIPFWRPESS